MKPVYRIDRFVDFNGVEREFIIAAVSIDVIKDCEDKKYDEVYINLGNCQDDYYIASPKLLLLGIAIRNANDKYDEERGMKIALGKALKMLDAPEKRTGKIIAVSDKGLVNSAVVDAILDQEAAYFKRNPGSYIAGYDKQARKKQYYSCYQHSYIFKYFLFNQKQTYFSQYIQYRFYRSC